jgi:alpha-galactosidase
MIRHAGSGNGGLSATENRTHSVQAMAAAPLNAGNDVRALDRDTRHSVEQEVCCESGSLANGPTRCAARRCRYRLRSLSEGYALAVVNRGDAEAEVTAKWSDLKLPANLSARDLWQHSDLGRLADGYQGRVAAHGVVMLRLQPN